MTYDDIKLYQIIILVSTFRTFDNRDKALICLSAVIHNNATFTPNNFTFDTDWIVTL